MSHPFRMSISFRQMSWRNPSEILKTAQLKIGMSHKDFGTCHLVEDIPWMLLNCMGTVFKALTGRITKGSVQLYDSCQEKGIGWIKSSATNSSIQSMNWTGTVGSYLAGQAAQTLPYHDLSHLTPISSNTYRDCQFTIDLIEREMMRNGITPHHSCHIYSPFSLTSTISQARRICRNAGSNTEVKMLQHNQTLSSIFQEDFTKVKLNDMMETIKNFLKCTIKAEDTDWSSQDQHGIII